MPKSHYSSLMRPQQRRKRHIKWPEKPNLYAYIALQQSPRPETKTKKAYNMAVKSRIYMPNSTIIVFYDNRTEIKGI